MASAPSAPQIVIRPDCIENYTIDFRWDPPSSDGGSAVTSYILQMTSPSSFTQSIPASYRYKRLGNLINGSNYSFQLQASNAIGLSPAATFRSVQVGSAPGEIADIGVHRTGISTASLSWTNSLGSNNSEVLYHAVKVCPPTSQGTPDLFSASTIQIPAYANQRDAYITGVANELTYDFIAQSINASGYSPPITFASTSYLANFSPSSITGLQLWLDMSDPLYHTTSNTNVSTILDKSGNGYDMIEPSTNEVLPVKGTPIINLSTAFFEVGYGIKQATTLDGVTNMFIVGRQGYDKSNYNSLFSDDSNLDWLGGLGDTTFIDTLYAQPGIYDASGWLYRSRAYKPQEAIFSSITLPPADDIFLLNVNGITGSTRYQGLFYDRTFSRGWSGDFAEVLMYSNALTSNEIADVRKYLEQKWYLGTLSAKGLSYWLNGTDSSLVQLSNDNQTIVSTFSGGLLSNIASASDSISYPLFDSFYGGYHTSTNSQSLLRLTNGTFPYQDYSIFFTFATQLSGNAFNILSGNLYTNSNDILFFETNGNGGFRLSKANPYVTTSNTLQDWTTNMASIVFSQATSTAKLYINGALNGVGFDLTQTTNSNGQAFFGNGTPSRNYNGIINESLMYNYAMSDAERQGVERYMGQKYQISPYYRNIADNFAPTTISSCRLWLDSADSSKVILSGSNVIRWEDKSGGGRHASNTSSNPTIVTQSTLLYYGGITTSTILFEGSNYLNLPNNTFPASNSPFTLFVAGTLGGFFFGLNEFLSAGDVGTSNDISFGTNNSNLPYAPTMTYGGGSNLSGWYRVFDPYIPPAVVAYRYDQTTIRSFVNQTQMIFTSLSNLDVGSTSNFLGANLNAPNYFSGTLNEVVLYDRALPREEFGAVNYYLQEKWAFQPQSNFSVANVPNLRAWYDAADTASLQLGGGNEVSRWNDKSGNERHATASGSARPIYYAPNGASPSYLSFSSGSSNYMNLPNGTLPTGNSPYTIIYALNFTGASSFDVLAGGLNATNQALRLRTDGTNVYHDWQNNDIFVGGFNYDLRVSVYSYISGYRSLPYGGTADSASNHNMNAASNAIGVFLANPSGYLDASVREILIFDRFLSKNETYNIENYLRRKWGAV